jgi:hypothetical protein
MNVDLFAQQYLWPTDASRWMTSSFAETRPRRMHAAIDIKTWNRTGYKVFAIRDGYIQRIRVSPFGYGKAIYQKLDTGEIAIYAHLDGFNAQLEAYIANEQENDGRYRIDRYLTPDVFPFKQGDLLAFSGETGIGVPHLHFEMRDEQNRPFNPLLRGFEIEDSIPPTPSGLAVLPLTPGSRVNDDFRPHRFALQRINKNSYRVIEPLTIEGEIGLAVKSFDKTDEGNNKFHVYQLDLFIDNKPHFSIRYDKFSYCQNHFVQLERNFRLERRGFGRYIHLFLESGNKLPFYRSFNDVDGKLLTRNRIVSAPQTTSDLTNDLLSPGYHTFRIELKDFFGNTTSIAGEFISGKSFKIKPEMAAGDSIQLKNLVVPNDIVPGQLKIWENQPGRNKQWLIKHVFANDGSNGNRTFYDFFPLLLSANGRTIAGNSFRLVVEDINGILSWPAYYSTPRDAGVKSVNLRLFPEFYDDYIRVGMTTNLPLKKIPFVEITNGDGSTLYPEIFQKNLAEYIFIVALQKLQGRNIRIVAQAESTTGQITASEISFDNHRIQKNNGGELRSADGQIRVVFGQRSLYRDLYGRIDLKTELDLLQDPKMVSNVYSVEPQDVPLNSGALVAMKIPDSLAIQNPRQLGIYYRAGRDRWVFIDNKIDLRKKEVSAKVFSLEDFVIRIDDTPPTVVVRTPARNRTLTPRQEIRVYAKDRESGFASEEALVLKIDGRRVIAEYDPENALIIFKPRKPFTPGTHRLEFTATDRCGNVTQTEQNFVVARSAERR